MRSSYPSSRGRTEPVVIVFSSSLSSEHSSQLAVVYQASIIVEDIVGLVACKVLIGHEADDLVASPVAEFKVCIFCTCAVCQVAGVDRSSGTLKLYRKLFCADIVLQVVEEARERLRRPGVFERAYALSPNPIRSRTRLLEKYSLVDSYLHFQMHSQIRFRIHFQIRFPRA